MFVSLLAAALLATGGTTVAPTNLSEQPALKATLLDTTEITSLSSDMNFVFDVTAELAESAPIESVTSPPATKLFEWKQPTWGEAIPLGLATAAIWFDVYKTVEFRKQGYWEANPLLGHTPSITTVVLVGGVASTLLVAGIWYALPSKWRAVFPAAVFGVELSVIGMHYSMAGK